VRFPKAAWSSSWRRAGRRRRSAAPDIVRITPAPLYNSFEDVHRFCARIARRGMDEVVIVGAGPVGSLLALTLAAGVTA